MGTPEETKINETLINLQVSASFLKPLLKTESRIENDMWALKTPTEKSLQLKMGSAFAISSTVEGLHQAVKNSLPYTYEMFLNPYLERTIPALFSSIGVTMRTCISCMLHPKNPLLLDQAPQLKRSAHISERLWSLL